MSNSRNRNRRRVHSDDARPVPGAGGAFAFTSAGRRYTLPPASGASAKMQAGDLIDAIKDVSGAGDARLGIAMLEAVEPDPDAMRALRAMTVPDFQRTLMRWMREGGADLGKSGGSSN